MFIEVILIIHLVSIFNNFIILYNLELKCEDWARFIDEGFGYRLEEQEILEFKNPGIRGARDLESPGFEQPRTREAQD